MAGLTQNLSNDKQSWRRELGSICQVPYVGGEDLLFRSCGPRNDRTGCFGRKACRTEFVGDFTIIVPWHVDHDGGPQRRQSAPIGWILSAGSMPSQENQGVRRLAVGQGNLRDGRCPKRGGHARNNFKLDVGFT